MRMKDLSGFSTNSNNVKANTYTQKNDVKLVACTFSESGNVMEILSDSFRIFVQKELKKI